MVEVVASTSHFLSSSVIEVKVLMAVIGFSLAPLYYHLFSIGFYYYSIPVVLALDV